MLMLLIILNMILPSVDYEALLVRKFYENGPGEMTYEHIQKLRPKIQEVLWKAVVSGGPRERETRIRAELTALGELGIIDKLQFVDMSINLSAVEISGGWVWRSLADAYKPLPKLQWVVNGIFPRPSVSIIFGPPKTLKSMLLSDCSFAIASGHKWLQDTSGVGGFQAAAAPVCWVDLENGARRMAERWQAMGKARNLPETYPMDYLTMPSPWIDAGSSESIARLTSDLSKFGAGFVVIDHLAQVLGAIDENSNQMAAIMANLRYLAEALNLALVLIHHQTKNFGRFGISASDSVRGHGSILAACDLALMVERMATSKDGLSIKPVAVRGPSIDPFGAVFTYEWKPDGSRELEKARFFGTESISIDDQVETVIIEILESTPKLNQSELRAAAMEAIEGASDQVVRRVLAKMETAKRVYVKPGRQNSKIYELPE